MRTKITVLKLVTDVKEIRKCQSKLENRLKLELVNKKKFTIGFPGGSWVSSVNYNDIIWHSTYEIKDSTPRFWNGFGLFAELDEKKSNNIVVEINITFSGTNRRVSGLFAIDQESEDLILLHRGRVGGGRKGIGKNSFVGWRRDDLKIVYDEAESEEKAIVVANIDSQNFIDDISKFVLSVFEFKELTAAGVIDEATYIPDDDLKKKIEEKNNTEKTKRKLASTSAFERSPYVAEYAKRKANGKCQLCLADAPFKNRLDRPYLEAHHIIWLSKGGEDTIENTVALCPNCHRKMHALNLRQDILKLKQKTAES